MRVQAERLHIPFHLGYRPSLDGLRAIAVLLVIFFHMGLPLFRGGFLGVDIFFVLSGFLITNLLLTEHEKTGRLNLGAFYLRRGLRLLPGILFLCICVCFYAFLRQQFKDAINTVITALFAIFYVENWAIIYFKARPLNGALGHLWSLSVEEQFYIILPCLLIIALRWKLKPKTIISILTLGIAASSGTRLLLWFWGSSEQRRYNGLDTRADALLCGCLAAVVVFYNLLPTGKLMIFILRLIIIIIVAWLLWMGFPGYYGSVHLHVGGYTLVAIAVSIFLVLTITCSSTIVNPLLELPAMVWIGRISYGLYLWHLPINQIVRAPILRIIASFAAAAISYYFIEQPFLNIKKRYAI